MTLIASILNQRVYPGAGDVDDCSVVATVQAVLAANPGARKPSVPVFREAAGEPDRQGQADGLNLTQIITAVRTIWPDVRVRAFRAAPWEQFAAVAYTGGVSSLAVRSGDLPVVHRYGFAGLHQVAVEYDGGWWLANPLARQGSAPKRITEQALRKAINGYSNVGVYAAYFPEADVPGLTLSDITPFHGYVQVVERGVSAIRTADRTLVAMPLGHQRFAHAKCRVAWGGKTEVAYVIGRAVTAPDTPADAAVALARNVVPIAVAPDCRAQEAAAVTLALDHVAPKVAEVAAAILEARPR